MRLNFWQWLGIVLLMIGLILIIVRRTGTTDTLEPSDDATTRPVAPVAPGELL